MDTKALRQKILDLAIRGKLVPQDPNDEPASVLLERIRVQKQQMVKEGKLKAKDIKNDTIIFVGEDNLHYEKFQDGSVKCVEDEIPFEIPEGWEWVRLENCCNKEIKRGKSPKYSAKSGTLVFAQKCNTKSRGIDVGLALYLDESTLSKYPKEEYLMDGDIVINSTGTGTLGRVGIFRSVDNGLNLPIVPDSHITVIRPCSYVAAFYLYAFLKTRQSFLEQSGVGSTNQKELSPAVLKKLCIPLPPRAEQLRIISQFEKFFPIIEKINQEECQIQLLSASIKSRILDLAIRGKLVPQDPNDEPASVLLERIRAEKEELIKQGKIKRDKKESVIFKGEDNSYYLYKNQQRLLASNVAEYDLPNGWAWITLSDICVIGSGKTPPTNAISNTGDIPYFKISDMNIPENKLHMTKAENYVNSEYEGVVYDEGSFIFPKNGGAVLTNKKRILKVNAVVDLNTGVLSPTHLIDNNFAFILFLSIDMKNLYKGSTIPTLDLKTIGNLIFALPPLQEQKRIAQKIEISFSALGKISNSLS